MPRSAREPPTSTKGAEVHDAARGTTPPDKRRRQRHDAARGTTPPEARRCQRHDAAGDGSRSRLISPPPHPLFFTDPSLSVFRCCAFPPRRAAERNATPVMRGNKARVGTRLARERGRVIAPRLRLLPRLPTRARNALEPRTMAVAIRLPFPAVLASLLSLPVRVTCPTALWRALQLGRRREEGGSATCAAKGREGSGRLCRARRGEERRSRLATSRERKGGGGGESSDSGASSRRGKRAQREERVGTEKNKSGGRGGVETRRFRGACETLWRFASSFGGHARRSGASVASGVL